MCIQTHDPGTPLLERSFPVPICLDCGKLQYPNCSKALRFKGEYLSIHFSQRPDKGERGRLRDQFVESHPNASSRPTERK